MHRMSQLKVMNFRSFVEASFPLADFAPLVGYNNGGKTNLLAAVYWLLKPYALGNSDFNEPSKPVVIAGDIDGITSELLGKLIEQHRNRIQPFCLDGKLQIRRTQATPGGAVTNIVLEVRDPDTQKNEENPWRRNPTGIDAAIRALFPEPIQIGAMENATEDVGKSKSGTTIGKLIAEIMEPIEQQHGTEIRQALDGIEKRFSAEGPERAAELNEFDAGANEKLRDLFPGITVRLHIPTPEIRALFKEGTIKVFEEGIPNARDIEMMGHGAQRSIQMALVRYLAEMKRRTGGESAARTLLLIDEPELYLHPQAVEEVRSALKILSEIGYQVVFATHSPLMIDVDDMGNTLIICKTNQKGTQARKSVNQAVQETVADAPTQARLLFELGNASKILFSNRVLIAEGRTEQRLIPEIFCSERKCSLGRAKIGIVSLGGSGNLVKGLKVLNALGIPAKALADLDYTLREAVKSGLIQEGDVDLDKCRGICKSLSEKHGFRLANDGFPCTSEHMSASDALAIVAGTEAASPHIDKLHRKLLGHGIWLWKKGAIEDHLGLVQKGEEAWTEYALKLRSSGCEAVVADYQGICEFLAWLES